MTRSHPHPLVVLLLVVAAAALLLPESVWAACPEGATKTETLPNGCKMQYLCNGVSWEEQICVVGTTVACTGCGGKPGTATCDSGCAPVACSVGPEVCNNCDDDGDTYVDNALGNYANTLKESCNPHGCSIGGHKTCTAGVWSSCNSCGGTVACTGCGGRSGAATCDASCNKGGCNVGAEDCNNCDDNADGYVDNAPGVGQHSTLTRSCNPNGCSVSGNQTCAWGAWGACGGCGGTMSCSHACGGTGATPCSASCQPSGDCTRGETCNDCDDDTDGVEDNGLSCQPCEL